MRTIIRLFDRFLRWTQGIFEICDEPACVFRLRVGRAPHPLQLPGSEVPAGSKVLELHLWNERAPPIPAEGPDLALGLLGARMLISSCRAAAREIQHNPRLAGVQAVGGVTVLFAAGDGSGAEKLFTRLGFSIFPYRNPLGRFGEFWENLYTWALMWTFNAASLRRRRLLQLRRTEMWMPAAEFLRRYDAGEAE